MTTVDQEECDVCGNGSPSNGLRLCAKCEAWERACNGDVGQADQLRRDIVLN
jgi:hypothetical protein